MMQSDQKCTQCGAPLPQGAAGPLCSACAPAKVAHERTVVLGKTEAKADALRAAAKHGSLPRRFGDYELVEELAQGGMGVVYKARELSLNRLVALKMILGGQLATETEVKRFRIEAEAASNLEHPNIVPIFGFGELEGRQYYTMRLVEGGSLADRLEQYTDKPQAIAELIATVARAVHFAHQRGILHRDLKPANILFDTEGRPHVADFGLARRVKEDSELTNPNVVVGSPSYMSPEQASGSHTRLTTAADVYSLGAILYLMLTGRPPLQGTTSMETINKVLNEEPLRPRELGKRIPLDLETICLKCLEKDPAERYGSAEAFADDLDRWLRHEPIRARPITPPERAYKWARRHPASAALVFVVIASITTLVISEMRSNARFKSERDYAIEQKKFAEQQRKLADELRIQANQSAAESLQRLTRQNAGNAIRLLSTGDTSGALLWFVDAMKLQGDNTAAQETFRLRYGSVLRECPKLVGLYTNQSPVTTVLATPDGRSLVAFAKQRARIWDLNTCEPVKETAKIELLTGPSTLSPDGQAVLFAAKSNEVRFAKIHDGELILPPLKHDAPVTAVAISSDGSLIASAAASSSKKGSVYVWDGHTGKRLLELEGHQGQIDSLAFSGNGRYLASASRDHTARLWSLPSGKLVGDPLQHNDAVTLVTFSPDSTLLATVGRDMTARLWRTTNAESATVSLRHNGAVTHAAFSPDGRRIVTATSENSARVWDATTGEPVTPPLFHNSPVLRAIFSPDGRRVLTVSERTVRLWNAANGLPLSPPLQHREEVLQAAFSTEGRRMLILCADQTVRVWSVAASEVDTPVLNQEDPVLLTAFSPDGRFASTASSNRAPQIWKMVDGILSPYFNIPAQAGNMRLTNAPNRNPGNPGPGPLGFGTPLALLFTPDSRHLIFIDTHDGRTMERRVFALTNESPLRSGMMLNRENSPFTKREPGTFKKGDFLSQTKKGETTPKNLNLIAISPDGRFGLVSPRGERLRLIDFEDSVPKKQETPFPHNGTVASASFSKDGRYLAIQDEKDSVTVWDTHTLRAVGPTIKTKLGVAQFALSPDAHRLVIAQTNNAAQVWDIASGKPLGAPLEHGGELTVVTFSPNSQLVLTASADNTARIWDAAKGEPVTPFLEHGGRVSHAEFSRDGQRVLTASWDNSARVWDAITGEMLTAPLAHEDHVLYATFSPDGRRVLTGSDDRTARLWSLPSDDRPVEDLSHLAHVLSGRRIDSVGSLTVISTEKLVADWENLRARYPEQFRVSKLETVRWHTGQMNEAESAKDWKAMLFHIDHLKEILGVNGQGPNDSLYKGPSLNSKSKKALDNLTIPE